MVKESRYHFLNKDVSYAGGPVLYWMNRDMRAEDNWALLYAQEVALKHDVPLLVLYNLDPHFLGGTNRQYDFKVRSLSEVARQLQEKNISFFLVTGSETQRDIVSFIQEHSVGYLVTDFSPLRIQREWLSYVVSHAEIPCVRVDAHNIVPVWIASQKQEVGARTLRPKLYTRLPEFLEPFPPLKKHPFPYASNAIDWQKVLDSYAGTVTTPVSWCLPGVEAAEQTVKTFIDEGLDGYGVDRNDPTKKGQSNISPYLHYGIIAPARVALLVLEKIKLPIDAVLDSKKNKAKVDLDRTVSPVDHAASFLEELIVRRELADNFCFYNSNYDSVSGFALWAQTTLKQHESDTREYLYSIEQFEQAVTHDPLWNAAQKEMLITGKMHGYMRMYWAKKILEWTKSATEAMTIAIYLNDIYELDGRDPNGYAGIAWSIGGVHDRPWFNRPIFGLIRYMARSGCDKKFDTDAYIQKWMSQ